MQMPTNDIRWYGIEEMQMNIRRYGDAVHFAVVQVANYWAPVIETFAKNNAPWTDRTANARQSLHAWVEELSKDTVNLYLSHGVSYGIFLEVRFAGQYAIIWPTLEQHLEPIAQMLRGIFGQ